MLKVGFIFLVKYDLLIIIFDAGVNYGHFCETDLYAVYMTAHVHVACDTHVQSDYRSMTAVISIFPFHHPTAPLTSVRKSILSRWSRSFKWPTHYDAIKIEQCVTAVSTYSMARLNHPYIHFHLSFRSVKVKAISQKDCSWPLRYSLRIIFISNSLFSPHCRLHSSSLSIHWAHLPWPLIHSRLNSFLE